MDRSMCSGQGCSFAKNCMRCPKSGTVAALYNQSWFGVTPAGGENCHFYLPVRDSLDEKHFVDLYHPLWRAVEFLVNWSRNMSEFDARKLSPNDVFVYVSDAFFHVVGDPEDQLGQDIVEWFQQGPQGDLLPIEQVSINLIAVVSMMDTALGFPRYVDKLVAIMPEEKTGFEVFIAVGNGSIN